MSDQNDFDSPASQSVPRKIVVEQLSKLVKDLEDSLVSARKRKERYEHAIDRSVVSLLSPDSASSITPALKTAIVRAELVERLICGDKWLLAVLVTNSGERSLPTPSLLVHCGKTTITYTSRLFQLPFVTPDGAAVGRAVSQIEAGQQILICAVINVSRWVHDTSVRVLLSGCIPPFDCYNIDVGECSLMLADRLNVASFDTCGSQYVHVLASCLCHVTRYTSLLSDVTVDQMHEQLRLHRFSCPGQEPRVWMLVHSGHSLCGVLVCLLSAGRVCVLARSLAQLAVLAHLLHRFVPDFSEWSAEEKPNSGHSLLSESLHRQCAFLSQQFDRKQPSPDLPSVSRRFEINIDGAEYCEWRQKLHEIQMNTARAVNSLL